MKNKKLLLLVAPFLLGSVAALSSCDSNLDGDVVLRILNAEDYIYEYEDGDEECFYDDESNLEQNKNAYQMDMLDQFEAYWEDKDPEGRDLQIVYDTYDTNETMFNELKTGKTTYDVIIPSDYMVQKLASLNMLHEIDHKGELWANISPLLAQYLESIKIPDADGNPVEGALSDYDYCVPYMWGTLGIMYNVDYYLERLQEIDETATEDDVHTLFESWDCLYGENANTNDDNLKEKYGVISGTFSIKDSVRDTYTVSLIHNFAEEVKTSQSANELKAIINRHDADTIASVMEDMLKLKDNAFGFETDSGKTDMTTQKIGANLCWSGDATWAITEARDSDLNLYYSLPIGDLTTDNPENKSGSNIWFDCFCMPKNAKDEANRTADEQLHYDLGEEFIEFMSRPENAAQNCYCVGYTPAVIGDDMLYYMQSCYDTPTIISDYEDLLGEMEPTDEGYEDIEAEYLEIKNDYDTNKNNPDCYVSYNLNYFFNPDYDPNVESTTTDEDYIFIAEKDMSMRELAAQYPEQEGLSRLAIMNDFGPKGNQALLDMWESVRTNPLPDWGWVIVIIELAAAAALGIYFVSKKVIRKNLKKQRA